MSSLEWILIIAAFALVAVLWVTLYPRPRLRIGDRGFLDRELQLGWIRWDEIEGAYSPNVRDSDGIRIKLRPGHKLNATADDAFNSRGFSSVRRLVRRRFVLSIVAAWIITVPASALLAAMVYGLLRLL